MTTPQQEPEQVDVVLWLMHLPAAEAAFWPIHPELDASEVAHAEAIHDGAARGFYVASVVFRRTILGKLLELSPAEVRFAIAPQGVASRQAKPRLAGHQNPADWRFNVSHSGELAVLALGRGREVGVDLERMRENVNWRGAAQTAFSPSEQATLRRASPQHQHDAFYRLWTAKEAYLKACGVGLSVPLGAVGVALQGDAIRVVQAAPGDLRHWQGQRVPVPAPWTQAYRAAVVVQAAAHERLSLKLQLWSS